MDSRTKCTPAGLAIAAVVLVAAPQAWGQCKPAWSPLGAGIEKAADALLIFDDGSGPSLYVGGEFTSASGISAKRIARWHGQEWHPVGAGFEQWTYSSLARAAVFALTEFDDGTGPALYAGGTFVESGSTIVNAIAKWDGSQWHPLGEGFGLVSIFDVTPVVSGIVVFDDGHGEALYAAGNFNRTASEPLNNIARWNGTSWLNVGGGVWPGVHDMVVHDDGTGDAIYVAGGLWFAGSTPVRGVARWDGTDWTPVSGGLEYPVWALAVLDDGTRPLLYAVEGWHSRNGYFSRVSKWDGLIWTPMGDVLDGTIRSLIAFDDGTGPALVAGTTISLNGGLMKWDGTQWIPYLGGIQGSRFSDVKSLLQGSLEAERSLFVSGSFGWIGPGVSARYIAQWNTCVPNCYPDCDQSGTLDIFDFLCFQNAFVAGEPYACDCEPDPACNIFDFLCFQTAFAAGCP